MQWNITGIDPPELVYFARKQIQELRNQGILVFECMHEKSMIQMIIEHKTPPSRKIRYCCDELKEKRYDYVGSSIHSFGVRKAESVARKSRNEIEFLHKNKGKRMSFNFNNEEDQLSLFLHNDNSGKRQLFENCTTKGVRAINPIITWSDKLLWDFTKDTKTPYCELYDQGFKRLGCIGCPMAGKSRIEEFKRYPKFKQYYFRAFEKMLIKRKEDKVDEKRMLEGKRPMGWNNAHDVMEWWLETNRNEEQLKLDELGF